MLYTLVIDCTRCDNAHILSPCKKTKAGQMPMSNEVNLIYGFSIFCLILEYNGSENCSNFNVN